MNKNTTRAQRIAAAVEGHGHTTHGMSMSYEYIAWQNMKSRCFNKNNKKYAKYGAVGITVCDRWKTSFENFFADMGNRPSANHSIDRIDSRGNYSPENCRWADKKTQSENRPGWVNLIEFNGERKTITEWAKDIGIARKSLYDRFEFGWSIEEALTIPKGGKRG